MQTREFTINEKQTAHTILTFYRNFAVTILGPTESCINPNAVMFMYHDFNYVWKQAKPAALELVSQSMFSNTLCVPTPIINEPDSFVNLVCLLSHSVDIFLKIMHTSAKKHHPIRYMFDKCSVQYTSYYEQLEQLLHQISTELSSDIMTLQTARKEMITDHNPQYVQTLFQTHQNSMRFAESLLNRFTEKQK